MHFRRRDLLRQWVLPDELLCIRNIPWKSTTLTNTPVVSQCTMLHAECELEVLTGRYINIHLEGQDLVRQ